MLTVCLRKQLADTFAQNGMQRGSRQYFAQRFQYETPLMHTRMRNRHCITFHDAFIIEQKIEIDRARAEPERRCFAEGHFDLLKNGMNVFGRLIRFDARDGVQKIRLIRHVLRSGLIDSRESHGRPVVSQERRGLCQIILCVDVAAERDEDSRYGRVIETETPDVPGMICLRTVTVTLSGP